MTRRNHILLSLSAPYTVSLIVSNFLVNGGTAALQRHTHTHIQIRDNTGINKPIFVTCCPEQHSGF